MEKMIIEFLITIISQVTGSIIHNWLPLTSAIFIAAVLKVYINQKKLQNFLARQSKVSVLVSVTAGAFTPLCACGTSAVIIAMAATTLPWAPIMAFLTSSPLMSPQGFILVTGIIDFNFAVALAIASVIIGLGSGFITHLIEKRTHFLTGQIRFKSNSSPGTCSCIDTNNERDPLVKKSLASISTVPAFVSAGSSCQTNLQKQNTCDCIPATDLPDLNHTGNYACAAVQEKITRKPDLLNALNPDIFFILIKQIFSIIHNIKWKEIFKAIIDIGLKKILLFYSLFFAVGYLINLIIPEEFIATLFSARNIFSVPLAGLIGFPIYVTGESVIPLIKSLLTSGASRGAMLAFLITGPGTSAWVIAGISTFMKKRATILYIAFLLSWAIILGYLYDLLSFFRI